MLQIFYLSTRMIPINGASENNLELWNFKDGGELGTWDSAKEAEGLMVSATLQQPHPMHWPICNRPVIDLDTGWH
ncbi:hypothetical protein IMY05_003G0166500 [Salix suchowensis]|nr:hypothetical protein IMY05_003G0166500 [Salix suchowensis]